MHEILHIANTIGQHIIGKSKIFIIFKKTFFDRETIASLNYEIQQMSL